VAAFVLDKRLKPPMPCSQKRARLLLARGRALVHHRYPFTIHLKDRIGSEVQPVRVKLDPGSKTTGIAVVTGEDANKPAKVLHLFELSRKLDKYGSPRGYRKRIKAVRDFHRGGTRAKVPRGARAGPHIGRVAVGPSGPFKTGAGGIDARSCKLLHRADGFGFGWQPARSSRD
jgi:hypothetical protein